MGGKGKEKETKEGEGDRPRIACSGGPGSNPLYSICLPRIMSLPLDVIRLLGVSRRYTTHDATRFRDALAPHTQTQRYGERSMMISHLLSLS